MNDLGDIGNIVGEDEIDQPVASAEGSLNDLNWLSSGSSPYVPLQNSNIIPDLNKAWSGEEGQNIVHESLKLVRNQGVRNLEEPVEFDLHEDIVVRAAREAVMMFPRDKSRIAHFLKTRFPKEDLVGAEKSLKTIFAEIGLLGPYYIEASDFPTCSKGASEPVTFVKNYAKKAKFVVGKKECSECIHKNADRCSVFHKRIVLDVPYTEELAEVVEKEHASKGVVTGGSGSGLWGRVSPKKRIRLALLNNGGVEKNLDFTGINQPKPAMLDKVASKDTLAASQLLAEENLIRIRSSLEDAKVKPVIQLLKQEMLKGKSASGLVQALKLTFDAKLLQETKLRWLPVLNELGTYGKVYINQPDFSDCRKGADFVNKHNPGLKVIVAGEKCSSCIFSQASQCMMYGRKLVDSFEVTQNIVASVLEEHCLSGRLPPEARYKNWGENPRKALRNIHKEASKSKICRSVKDSTEVAFYGGNLLESSLEDAEIRLKVIKVAGHYLNQGLYGKKLAKALKWYGQKLRNSKSDFGMESVKKDLKVVLAEQGLQGIKYIDPTVYDDYGRGCSTASRLYKSRTAVAYVKIGSKCASCVYQTMPGVCSVLNKKLVVDPPYVDKRAEQKAVLESDLPVKQELKVASSLSDIVGFQLGHVSRDIALNSEAELLDLSLEFGNQNVKLP